MCFLRRSHPRCSSANARTGLPRCERDVANVGMITRGGQGATTFMWFVYACDGMVPAGGERTRRGQGGGQGEGVARRQGEMAPAR